MKKKIKKTPYVCFILLSCSIKAALREGQQANKLQRNAKNEQLGCCVSRSRWMLRNANFLHRAAGKFTMSCLIWLINKANSISQE